MFLEREDAFKEENVARRDCDFCDFFFPQQFAFWLIFQPRLKCNYGPFLHFPHSTLFTAWAFFEVVIKNCNILVQLSALLRNISPPLRHFATSYSQYFDFRISMTFNSRDFSLKSRRKIFMTFLQFSSWDFFFNVLKTNFIIGVKQKWLEDLKSYLHFFEKGRAFSKDRTLQDFKGDIATLLLLILILSVTFSYHE